MRLHMRERELSRGEFSTREKVINFIRLYIVHIFLIILAAGIVIIGILIIAPLYFRADEIGSGAGKTLGNAVGYAVGSFRGIADEIPRGLAEGREEGLSVKDTEAGIGNRIERIGELEVLRAGVRLDDYIQIAENYKALYVYKADAIFTIDLASAEVIEEEQGDGIQIILAEPHVELYIDDIETNKIAEWQKHFYSGEAETGYQLYKNARAQMESKSPEEIKNYDTLMELARDSAKKQLKILTEAICGDREIDIVFR